MIHTKIELKQDNVPSTLLFNLNINKLADFLKENVRNFQKLK